MLMKTFVNVLYLAVIGVIFLASLVSVALLLNLATMQELLDPLLRSLGFIGVLVILALSVGALKHLNK